MSRSKPDAGLWYYHAPETVKPGMPKVHYPPPSQIPGLNGIAVDPQQAAEEEREKSSKFWFKDTDTAYIKLAKMGGRKDLLVIPDQKGAGGEGGPAGNQASSVRHGHNNRRCDWFYQLDNLAEDAAMSANVPKTAHKFQVPEYMVHHERNPKPPADYNPPKTAPFATYGRNVTDSIDGGDPTDKTRRIQEPMKQGFGRRLAKQKDHDRKTQHGYYPVADNDDGYGRNATRSAPQPQPAPRYEFTKPPPMGEGDGTSMSKLLSFGYQKDWVDEQHKWWNDNEKRAIRFAEDNGYDSNLPPRTIMAGNPSNGPGVSGSEYSQQYAQYAKYQQPRPYIPEATGAYGNSERAHMGNGRGAPFATET